MMRSDAKWATRPLYRAREGGRAVVLVYRSIIVVNGRYSTRMSKQASETHAAATTIKPVTFPECDATTGAERYEARAPAKQACA